MEVKEIEKERERLSEILTDHLEAHDESRKAAQEKLHEICERLRAQINEFEERVDSELEEKFKAEDSRLQTTLNELRSDDNDGDASKAIKKAKAELLVMQSYDVVVGNFDEDIDGNEDDDDIVEEEEEEDEEERMWDDEDVVDVDVEGDDDDDDNEEPARKKRKTEVEGGKEKGILDLTTLCKLKTERKILLKDISFEGRKPRSLIPSFTEKWELSLSFTFFDEDEAEVLKKVDLPFEVDVKVWEKGNGEDTSRTLTKEIILGEPICFRSTFTANTTYSLKTRIVHQGMSTRWSDEAEFTTPEFEECCVWKECPDVVDEDMKYSVDEVNPRIATNIGGGFCTIIGNAALPPNKVTSWSIKILESVNNDGAGIYIGVAPFDIDQNVDDNYEKCGWYFDCYDSKLCSGPPHNYMGEEYGPRKEDGEYVHTGDSVGVVMDTEKGELSFVLNGVNLGVAYDGIPLDKPLVPCVLLGNEGDYVELDTSEVKETVVNSSIPVPSNITTKSITWDSITLTWDAVEGASFYQIEIDGSKFWNNEENTFTKRGLLPDTEHAFKVRAVRGNSVSEWSDIAKGRTQKESFEASGWKECPENVDEERKYSVDEENPRIATNIGGGFCTIIGNAALPPNKVTSWSIKILKSESNDGRDIFVGVAPSGINQNERHNFEKCGWYFGCCASTLHSGPPHNYDYKEYGPKKGNGQYVHTGDSVGVVMNTEKGELSFALNGVNLGVAYEGIPLDKPLVPCVILLWQGESVELVI